MDATERAPSSSRKQQVVRQRQPAAPAGTTKPSPAATSPSSAKRQRLNALRQRRYDRTTRTTTKPGTTDDDDLGPSVSGGEGEAVPDASDSWGRITDADRESYRKKQLRHWSEAFPLRMRRWIESSQHDIASRIFSELVVRLPMRNAGKEEVLGLVAEYGPAEYIGGLDATAKLRLGADANQQATPQAVGVATGRQEVDIGHSHVVRFRDGLDAVRCFLELNGMCIDPAKYNAAVEEVALILGDQNDSGDGSERSESGLKSANAIIESMAITNATHNGVRRGGAPKGPRLIMKPTGETPVAWLSRRLAEHAEEAATLYPIVASHSTCSWESFCRAVNLTAFVLATPTPNAFYAMTLLPGAAGAERREEIRSRSWEPSHWSVAMEALRHSNFDADGLLRLVDVSTDAASLVKARRYREGPKNRFLRLAHEALSDSPLLVGVVALLVACLVVTCIVVLLFQHRSHHGHPSVKGSAKA
jgi:hypothetical protein